MILLRLLILILDPFRKLLHFVLIAPLHVFQLKLPLLLVVVILVGYLLDNQFVRILHLLPLPQDVFQLFYHLPHLQAEAGLHILNLDAVVFLQSEHIFHDDFQLSPEEKVLLPQEVDFF